MIWQCNGLSQSVQDSRDTVFHTTVTYAFDRSWKLKSQLFIDPLLLSFVVASTVVNVSFSSLAILDLVTSIDCWVVRELVVAKELCDSFQRDSL